MREQSDLAISLARQIPYEPVSSVHQCRKAIKRLRAIVRLGRADEGADWRTTDCKFRDAGRILAEARDSHVLPKTATALKGDSASFPARSSAQETTVPEPEVVDRVIAFLEEARAKLEQDLGRGGWSLAMMCRALERTRRTTARRMERFRDSNKSVDAHSWRKGVQRYANQVRLLGGFLPDEVTDQLDVLDDLAGCLGDFHDLAVFRDALYAGRVHFDTEAGNRLLDKARHKQRELRRTALDAGALLFAGSREETDAPLEARV